MGVLNSNYLIKKLISNLQSQNHAKAIADALSTIVDFLRGGDDTVMDKELLQKVRDIESFTEEERKKIYDLLDMAISYHKTKKAYSKA